MGIPHKQDDELAEGRRLVIEAFMSAREKGRPEWRRMTTAVLKNRLLDLTNREFSERELDVPTFRHFVALYPDLLQVDSSQHPPVVEFVGDLDEGPGETMALRRITRFDRVRPDLWRAIIDYSSGRRYVWDADQGAAVAVDPETTDARPILPTVDATTYSSWRDAFAEAQRKLVSGSQETAIDRWKDESLPTSQLPPGLRGLWNAELKRRALDALQEWFSGQGLQPPEDMVRSDEGSVRSPLKNERLRELVLACVAVMTNEELESLALPASALLRLKDREDLH